MYLQNVRVGKRINIMIHRQHNQWRTQQKRVRGLTPPQKNFCVHHEYLEKISCRNVRHAEKATPKCPDLLIPYPP